MTNTTTPSDAELDAMIAEYRKRIYPQDMQPRFERAIMRAVLAKWGAPASGEPVAWLVYLPDEEAQRIYDDQDDPGYVDDLTNNADAEVTPLYPGTAQKAEVAPEGEYPPLPDPKFTRVVDGIPCITQR